MTNPSIPPAIAARLIEIDDADDPRVADYADIRERDRIGGGGFIAEGTVVLDHLLTSERFRPTSLFVLKARVAGLASRLARVPDDVPIFVTERDVMDDVAGFAIHRGVLAHGIDRGHPDRADTADPGLAGFLDATVASAGPLVVAIGLANHDNVGAIFRNAAAFGAAGVILDATSCHPLYRKAIRVSVGTALTLPWHHGADLATIIAALEAAGRHLAALSPQGESGISALLQREKLALLLGSEGTGLPEDVLSRCETVRIAMAPGIDSLNVATTAAIVLSRLYSAA